VPDLDLSTLRRKAGTVALLAFRSLPGPLKRRLVRVGTPNYTVGAVCVLEHEGEVLMLSQPHRRGWSLPGGLVDPGETPAEGVAREVREEVGLDIDPGDQVAVGFHPHSQSIDVIYRVVLAERPEVTLSSEPRRFRWWDLADLDDADQETRQIVALLRRAERPPRPGRLLS
jgi:8-oxo-dGTP diphosphatase